MAWDTERTRAVLLDAATAEFTEFGFSGARIERISLRAGVNRERLYSYFGNKQKLFEAVLSRALTASFENVPVEGEGPGAIGEFAGRYFDAALTSRSLSRLIMWEALEVGGAVDVAARTSRAQEKVAALHRAHPAVTAAEAQLLLLSIVSLVNTWLQAHNLREVITPGDADAETWRAWLVRSVTRMAAASDN
jgi:AcrR family transcriptional regulator